MIGYFSNLKAGKVALWCYLIWYLVTLYYHFDPSPRIWLNSLGISLVIGIALILSVSKPQGAKTDSWQIFRLFLMPFCVSSFSSLIKGQGFILIVSPDPVERTVSLGSCLLFISTVWMVKKFSPPKSSFPN